VSAIEVEEIAKRLGNFTSVDNIAFQVREANYSAFYAQMELADSFLQIAAIFLLLVE
jgi:4'-phosphopantetheinyl transferase EntD